MTLFFKLKYLKYFRRMDYTRNLLAVRTTTENLQSNVWESSVYFQWLKTLQALSEPRIYLFLPLSLSLFFVIILLCIIPSWSQFHSLFLLPFFFSEFFFNLFCILLLKTSVGHERAKYPIRKVDSIAPRAIPFAFFFCFP